jgi:pyruvate dehydrogenase E2 component (dihydrolipoamide acetyltransferase)
VRRGDVVAVVETQKGAIEIECFEEGTVESLNAEIGQVLPVGAPLATIRKPGVAGPASVPEPIEKPTAAASRLVRSTPLPRPPMPDANPLASPAARVRATELGLDIAGLRGTGPGGAVLLIDVEKASEAPPKTTLAAPPEPETAAVAPRHVGKPGLDINAMRQAIAAAMTRSKREIPHYYLAQTIDLQPATDWLAANNATRAPEARLLLSALFLRATAIAAHKVPEMNGHYLDGVFRPSKGVHAGLAVSLRGGGLVTPAIRDTDRLDLNQLMAAIRDLVDRARIGRLRSSEVADGTITVTSMGETGVDSLTGVIYPPQVAIVGFGAPVRRPWLVNESILPRTIVTLTLAADHRVSDGRRGAKFLSLIDAALKVPEAL